MSRRFAVFFIPALVASLGAACVLEDDEPGPVLVQGTVGQASIGGCWLLATPSGAMYQVIDLPVEFKSPGLKVVAKLRIRRDMASACMIGEIAEVERIELLPEQAERH